MSHELFKKITTDISEFNQELPKVGRLLGFDYGTKRIGVAISDLSRKIANPYGLLTDSFTKNLYQINQMIMREQVVGLVIGNPLLLNGDVGPLAQGAHQLARNFAKAGITLPILLHDERFTTESARYAMVTMADMSRQKQALAKDKVSAALILQSALDSTQT